MLSCLGLYSLSYWYIDNATTATEISCSSIQPCSHHPSNLSSTHDYPQPKSLLWCYIIPDTHCLSGQLWNIAYTLDTVYSNSGVFHYYRHTVTTWLFSRFLFLRTGLTPFCWEGQTEPPCANVNAMIRSEKYIKENDVFFCGEFNLCCAWEGKWKCLDTYGHPRDTVATTQSCLLLT